MILHYTSMGESVPDHRVSSFLLNKAKTATRSSEVCVCNFLVLRTAQVLIAERMLDPIDIMFKIEGKLVTHDELGHLLAPPINHSNPMLMLEHRFRAALFQRVMRELTPEQQEIVRNGWLEMFQRDVVAVITVRRPLSSELEDSPYFENQTVPVSAEQPSEIYITTPGQGRSLTKETLAAATKVTCEQWSVVQTPMGVEPVLVTSMGSFTIAQLQELAYDQDGFRIIMKPFDPTRLLVDEGQLAFQTVDSRFDL